jgi:hypothetical protein
LVAVVLEDIIKGFVVKNLSEKREALLSKIICKQKKKIMLICELFFV